MSKRTAVLVTGSRDWTEYGPIKKRLALYPEGSILIHGDCGRYVDSEDVAITNMVTIGADKIAGCIGRSLHFNEWPLPYFGDLGKRGGPARNKCMFDVLRALKEGGHECFVEAFPIGRSVGTRGMLSIVKSYNDAAHYGNGQLHHTPIPVHVTEGK